MILDLDFNIKGYKSFDLTNNCSCFYLQREFFFFNTLTKNLVVRISNRRLPETVRKV